MKKTLHLIMALFAFAFVSAQEFNDGTYKYNILSPTECEVIGWETLPTAPIAVNITSPVSDGSADYNVVQIGNGAFSAHGTKGTYRNAANSNITSITLPASVVTLADHACRDLVNMESINLENVVTLGIAACNSSTGLTGVINLTNCTTMNNYAFFDCHLITELNTPALVTIGQGGFYGMHGLTEFEVPNTVTEINSLFSGVTAVANVGDFSITQFQVNWNATELATLTSNSSALETNFFRHISDKSGITMYIPEDAQGETTILDAYNAHAQFGQFTNIIQGTMPNGTLSNGIIENNLDINIYPNPVNDIVNINVVGENTNVAVYDITGKLLLTANGKQVNVSSLSSGVYMLKMTSDNKEFVKRIIKK